MPKKKTKTKKGNNYCFPKKNKSKKKKNSCYKKTDLLNLIKTWNKENENNKIKYSNSENSNKLWNKLDEKINNCNNEWCWLDKVKTTDLKFSELFRPKHPKSWIENENEWLSNFDIEKVMKQYEESYNNFMFIGAIPIDYDYKINDRCVSEKLCKINISSLLNKGITKIGIVFNTDTHDKPGSHWISLFIDLDRKGIYYFDSVGTKYSNEIEKIISIIFNQCKQINYNMKVQYNNTSHQMGSTECGIYAVNFIIVMLTKKISFKRFCSNVIHDKEISKKRKIYFLTPN